MTVRLCEIEVCDGANYFRDTSIRPGWLTVGPQLTNSNFDRETYINNFKETEDNPNGFLTGRFCLHILVYSHISFYFRVHVIRLQNESFRVETNVEFCRNCHLRLEGNSALQRLVNDSLREMSLDRSRIAAGLNFKYFMSHLDWLFLKKYTLTKLAKYKT